MSDATSPNVESQAIVPAANDSEVTLELPPAETDRALLKTVQAHVLLRRSDTENRIAWTFVIAIVLALPVMLLAMIWGKGNGTDLSKDFQAVFEKWVTLIGPLAGAAVGVGAMSRSGDRQND